MRSVIIAATLLAFSAGAAFAGDCKKGEVLDEKTGKCIVMTDEKPAE